MNKKGFSGIAVMVVVVVLIAIIVIAFQGSKEAKAPISSTTLPKSPLDATYKIEEDVIVLSNGEAETPAAPGSASKIYTSSFGEPVFGDLDGDEDADAVVILIYEPGGTGSFFYIAAALNENGGYRGLNSILLGDRIAPQNTSIDSGEIVTNYADRRPEEPMSAQPSVGVSKYLKVIDGVLTEITLTR